MRTSQIQVTLDNDNDVAHVISWQLDANEEKRIPEYNLIKFKNEEYNCIALDSKTLVEEKDSMESMDTKKKKFLDKVDNSTSQHMRVFTIPCASTDAVTTSVIVAPNTAFKDYKIQQRRK